MASHSRQIDPGVVKSYASDFTDHKLSFILSPKQWTQFQLATTLNWKCEHLDASNVAQVPKTRGVYAHSIRVAVPLMPPTDYITYIGLVGDKKTIGNKGNKRHLQQRFKEYLTETDKPGRPLVWSMLSQYKGFMWFHYAEVPDESVSLTMIETALLDALLPPCNQEDFSINIKEARQIVYAR